MPWAIAEAPRCVNFAFMHTSFIISVKQANISSCWILSLFKEFIMVKTLYYLTIRTQAKVLLKRHSPGWLPGLLWCDSARKGLRGTPSSPPVFPGVYLSHILWQKYSHSRWANNSNGRESKETGGTMTNGVLPYLCAYLHNCVVITFPVLSCKLMLP